MLLNNRQLLPCSRWLLQGSGYLAAIALLSVGFMPQTAAIAQTMSIAASSTPITDDAPSIMPTELSSIRSEEALIQRLAGRAVKHTSHIGHQSVKSLPQVQRSATALTPESAAQPRVTAANLPETTPAMSSPRAEVPATALGQLKQPLTATTTAAQPTAPTAQVRQVAQALDTPMPPAQAIAVKSAPQPTVTTDRVYQAPRSNLAPLMQVPSGYAPANYTPVNYAPATAAPINNLPIPSYDGLTPQLAIPTAAQPGQTAFTNPAYLPPMASGMPTYYGMPRAPLAVSYRPQPIPRANDYGTAAAGYSLGQPVAPPMPALPSPYAALVNPYGNMMPQLTPPVAQLRSRQGVQQIAQQALPTPQYNPAPSIVPPYATPYAQVPQQYYAPQPQPYVPPQYQYVPQYLQPQQFQPQPFQPQQFQQPAQQPLPQLGAYPPGGYQQPAISNPLNAPLSVPVAGSGVPVPSTEASALKQPNQSGDSLIRSTATTQPSLTLQGVYQYLGDGSSARARISGVYPLSPRALFGATLDVSSGEGFADSPDDGFNVNELFFATSLPEIPNLRFVVGQMDLTSYFDRNSFAKDGATHFFNTVFQTNPALAAAGLGSRPGLLVNWSLSDNIEAKAAAFSASRSIDEFAFNGFAGEIGIRYGNGILRGTYVTGRDSGNNDSFQEAFSIDRGNNQFGLLKDDRESAFGLNGEVFIPNLKMGIFARYGRYENIDAGESADTYGAGVSFLDVFSTDDRIGLAYGNALSNDSLRRRTGQGKVDALELFYDFRFLPNLRLGVSLQQRNAFSEVVAGVRVKTEFDITPKGRVMQ